MRVAYLGPRGTFSEEALGRSPLVAGGDPLRCASIPDVAAALTAGEADYGVLPMESSLEGAIGITLDLLAARPELKIRREIVLPVTHHLMAAPGTEQGRITRVLSHPQALAQCHGFLERHLPRAERQPVASTAEAARVVAGHRGWAALASTSAAREYGLRRLVEDVADHSGNTTRFVVVGHEDERRTGCDRTSIAFMLDRDQPGGLHAVLGEIAEREINLSRIESRPKKSALGHYIFFADLEGHREDPPVAEALAALEQRLAWYALLGSYPRAT